MTTMKIASLAFLCILALSHAARKRKNQVKGNVTVEGTLYLNVPIGIPEPEHIMILVKVGDQKPAESLLPWKSCAKDKKCQYKVRNIAGNMGQKFAVGVHLNYVHYFGGMAVHDPSIPAKFAWSSATIDIKGEVNTQDINYDITVPRVTPLHPGHGLGMNIQPAPSGTPTTNTISSAAKQTVVNVHGTVEVILPVGSTNPAGIFIKLNNGDGKRYETNVPWNLCSANRCPYTIDDVPNHVGHTYTVGVTEYYYGNNNDTDPNYEKNKRDRHNHVVWSTKTAVLKPGENKQDIRYDKALSSVTLVVLSPVPTTASAVIPPATTSNVAPPASTSPVIPPVSASTSPVIPAVAASTSPVVPPIPAATSAVVPPVPASTPAVVPPVSAATSAVVPPVPAATSAVVPPVPAATSAVVPPVSAATYAVVPPVPAATSAVVPPVPASTPAVVPPVSAAISAVVPPVPAATSAVVPPVPAATSAVVPPVPAPTSAVVPPVPAATSAVIPAATSKITVEGKLRVNLTDEIPKPDGIMLYLQIEGHETLHLTSYHWPSACPGDKCQYSIKDVIASVSKKYYIGVSLYYSPFGSNRGKPNKQAWSKVITVLKDGENKEDIMYYPAMPDVVCMNC